MHASTAPSDRVEATPGSEDTSDATWQEFWRLVQAPCSTETTPLQRMLAMSRKGTRVCLLPKPWNELWQLLLQRGERVADEQAPPPPPLALQIWSRTSVGTKAMCFRAHLAWAARCGSADEALRFLERLDDTEWYHVAAV